MYASEKSLATYMIGEFPFPFVKVKHLYNAMLYDNVEEFIKSSYPNSKSEYLEDDTFFTRFDTADEVIECGIKLEEMFGIPYKE